MKRNEEKVEEFREKALLVAAESLEKGDATGWFDLVYEAANGDPEMIPWTDLEPNRFFVEWELGNRLNGNDKRALVVGCGLGDEAKFLNERGFEVTAFDISKRAIEWAKQIHKASGIKFFVENLFESPEEWIGAFDFVIEVYTIQALPLSMRNRTIDAISSFVKEGGELVVVQRLREDGELEPDGPPWHVSRSELKRFEEQGLSERDFRTYLGDEEEPITRFVAHYRK